MTDTTDHREIGPGHNAPPDEAKRITDQMARDYEELTKNVAALLADVRANVPDTIETESDNGIVAEYVAKLRDAIKRTENHREAEKAPYLRAGQAIDQFFKGMSGRLEKARDIIHARGTEYTRRKVAAERMERERLAREAAEAARAEREAAAKAAREAAELEAAAARARKQENIEKLEQAASERAVTAEVKTVDAMIAGDKADEARIAALASSADIARTRHDTGHLSTAKQAPHVEIVDADALDIKTLWPFISEAEKLRALKAWAKLTAHKKPMNGAIIEMRDVADYR